MEHILFSYLNHTMVVSVLVLLLLLIKKNLNKHVSSQCFYLCCIVFLLGYLIPFRPYTNFSFFTFVASQEAEQTVENENSTEKLKMPSDVNDGFSKEKGALKDNTLESDPLPEFSSSPWEIVCSMMEQLYLGFQKNILPFTLLWFLGLSLTLVYHGIRYFKYYKSIQRLSFPIAGNAIQTLLDSNKSQLNIKEHVICKTCPAIGSPITIGFLHPLILLPDTSYSKEELNYILKHELVHIKRKDILLQFLLLLCIAIHWYNPVVYIFASQWSEYCENSCDSIVLHNSKATQRMQYSKILLKCAANQNQVHSLLLIHLYGGKKFMKNRIKSILDTNKKKKGILVIIVLALLICSTTLFTISKSEGKRDNSIPLKTDAKSSAGTDATDIAALEKTTSSKKEEAPSPVHTLKPYKGNEETKTLVKIDVESLAGADATDIAVLEKTTSSKKEEELLYVHTLKPYKAIEETTTDTASLPDTEIKREEFINYVKTFEGANYTWGGDTPEIGFDCSGFIQYIYAQYGYNLPRTIQEQYDAATVITENELQPGDLVFYKDPGDTINHTAIYLGDNSVIHASNKRVGVIISHINYRTVNGYGKILNSK